MSTEVPPLTARLDAALTDSADITAQPWLWRPLLQLLATGAPASAEDIATATGRQVNDVRDALAGLPSLEFDEQGRVVGSGITLRPTPHRFEIDGRTLYTWCALDTLIFPAILGRTAQISSPCQATGDLVHLTVAPGQVVSIDPPTAVVSLVVPEPNSPVRTAFCNHVHFFRSPQAAQPWLDEHPDAAVLPVQDALGLGQRLAAARPGTSESQQCDCS